MEIKSVALCVWIMHIDNIMHIDKNNHVHISIKNSLFYFFGNIFEIIHFEQITENIATLWH